jgi:hypothetical protein
MPEGAESLYALTFMNDDALQSGITYDLTIKDARKFIPRVIYITIYSSRLP